MYPRLEDDGWELEDAEEVHRQHPRTFSIPSAAERAQLAVGDVVKLIFLFPQDDGPQPYIQGERLYVRVTARDGSRYRGRLLDSPALSSAVQCDDVISFGPEHVATLVVRADDPRHPHQGR